MFGEVKKIWNGFKRKCAIEYINSIIPQDKSKRERLKWKVEISGVTLDDLDNPPREIPFSKAVFSGTKREAEDVGKIEYDNGNSVEIWHLIKRW